VCVRPSLSLAKRQGWEFTVGRRVPGLPIRNYAGSCNSSVHLCTHVNAIHVTAEKKLSVCIWFQNWAHLGPKSTVPMHPQPRPFTLQLFLDFLCNFFPRMAPQFFCHHDSPSNLAESRYPPRKSKRDIKHVMPSVCVSTTLRGILRKHNLIKVADMPCAGCECVVEVVAYKGVVRVKG